MDEFLQSSPPAPGDEQPVPHGGMVCRHGQDRGGEDCGYAASLGQRKRVAHIPTADTNAAAESCLILKDKGRRDHTLTSAIPGPRFRVHFRLRGRQLASKPTFMDIAIGLDPNSAWDVRWIFLADMNRDGYVTISDFWLWIKWVFYAPGDWILLMLMMHA